MELYLDPIILQYGRLLEGDSASLNMVILVKDFEALGSIVLADPLGWSLLSQGGLSAQTQKRVMGKLMDQTKAKNLTRVFVFLLIQNRRLRILPAFMDFCRKRVETQGRDVAQLVTAKAFSAEELEKIIDLLNSENPQGTELDIKVDPQLLGGAILFWRGLMIDGSIRTLLSHLT